MKNIENIRGIPSGYVFDPTDLQLVEYYLKRKINNEDIPYNLVQDGINVYASTPDQIAEMLKPRNGESMYVFSPREKKYGKGIQPNRTIGGGYYWRQSSGKEISDINDVHIGTATKLEYMKKTVNSKKGIKTKWLMTEYTIVYSQNNETKWNDLVLCKIYETPRQTKNNDSEQADNVIVENDDSKDTGKPKRRRASADQLLPSYPSQPIASSSMEPRVHSNAVFCNEVNNDESQDTGNPKRRRVSEDQLSPSYPSQAIISSSIAASSVEPGVHSSAVSCDGVNSLDQHIQSSTLDQYIEEQDWDEFMKGSPIDFDDNLDLDSLLDGPCSTPQEF